MRGGHTLFNGGTTTAIGSLLSEKALIGTIVAAGPVYELAHALFFTYQAHVVSKSEPEASRYLTMMSFQSVLNHAVYAFTALYRHHPGHDFYQLSLLGLNPIVATVGILALPLILKAGLVIKDKLQT